MFFREEVRYAVEMEQCLRGILRRLLRVTRVNRVLRANPYVRHLTNACTFR